MELTKKQFVESYQTILTSMYATSLNETSYIQRFHALGALVKGYFATDWQNTAKKYDREDDKQIFYFSIEFLPGQLLQTNLLNLGITDVVVEGLKELGIDYATLVEAEPDPGLGNGGLGRLASCFMDSMASVGMAGNGNGIRYRYGLFKQAFVNGYQVELPDDWMRNGNVWEIRKENRACIIKFGGNAYLRQDALGHFRAVYENTEDVLAVPYDTAMVGYDNQVVNTMRLWSAELPFQEDETTYTHEQRDAVDQITEILYPDDSNYAGRLLRLKQEYFFVSAGVQSIIRHYRKGHWHLDELAETVAIHINDTHPAMVIPELMRILMDDEQMSWEQAWAITQKVCSYTNHTILQEALEKWPEDMFANLLPRIYQIIQEINHRFRAQMIPLYGESMVNAVAVIGDGTVRMGYLAVIGSHSVNGVAKLHTQLLKTDVLHNLYVMYPQKFNNKTNGITLRRWVHVANPKLSELIDGRIGINWRTNPREIKMLKAYSTDQETLQGLAKVKQDNKQHLADFIQDTMDLTIDPNALFDVQIKRLHAYKRQLLHVLYILDQYIQIKENKVYPKQKRVHIFGAKAAPSYYYAKEIIKFINAMADLVNNDPDVKDLIKIVFIPNYGVSVAQRIIPAADVGEQISLASKEASGTSNMKLMANGAITVATMDGANIEIHDAVGEDNIMIFGLNEQQVYAYYANHNYNASEIYNRDTQIHRLLDALIDGTVPGIQTEGHDIFNALVTYGDEYFILKDFPSYVEAQAKIDSCYQNQELWQQMSLLNIAASGSFSADYTVMRYGEDIWQVPHSNIVN